MDIFRSKYLTREFFGQSIACTANRNQESGFFLPWGCENNRKELRVWEENCFVNKNFERRISHGGTVSTVKKYKLREICIGVYPDEVGVRNAAEYVSNINHWSQGEPANTIFFMKVRSWICKTPCAPCLRAKQQSQTFLWNLKIHFSHLRREHICSQSVIYFEIKRERKNFVERNTAAKNIIARCRYDSGSHQHHCHWLRIVFQFRDILLSAIFLFTNINQHCAGRFLHRHFSFLHWFEKKKINLVLCNW